MVLIIESAKELETHIHPQHKIKIKNLGKLDDEIMKHFQRNKHVTIRDTEDVLRMFYHWFEQIVKIIVANENFGNYYTLWLKHCATP